MRSSGPARSCCSRRSRSAVHDRRRASAAAGDSRRAGRRRKPIRRSSSRPTACARTWSTSTPARARADLRRPDEEGRAGANGLHPGLPAEHRRRLVHAGHRSVAGRARLDEQHLPPHRRGGLQQPDEASARAILQADTIAAGRRASRQEGRPDRVGRSRPHNLAGTDGRLPQLLLGARRARAPSMPAEQAGAAAFGVSYQVAALAPATGWTNVPGRRRRRARRNRHSERRHRRSRRRTRTASTTSTCTTASSTASRRTTTCSSCRTGVAKNGARPSPNLARGDLVEIKLTGADGLIGTRAGQTAGFYVKLIDLAGDRSQLVQALLHVRRSRDRHVRRCNSCRLRRGETVREAPGRRLPDLTAADFAPLEAGDRSTRRPTSSRAGPGRTRTGAYSTTSSATSSRDTDLLWSAIRSPTSSRTSSWPRHADRHRRRPEPVLRRRSRQRHTGRPLAIREGYIRGAYHEADAKLALARG